MSCHRTIMGNADDLPLTYFENNYLVDSGIKRNIFQRVFSWFFPGVKYAFFPLKLAILVHPKRILVVLKSDKAKKNFLLFRSIFPFFLVPLFPVGQQKFPGENCQGVGGHSAHAPPPRQLRHCWWTIYHSSFAEASDGLHFLTNIPRVQSSFTKILKFMIIFLLIN